jgi:hypothetical protein
MLMHKLQLSDGVLVWRSLTTPLPLPYPLPVPPCLAVLQRDSYIRHVSSTEGLAALAAAVVRNASSVLKVGVAGWQDG